MRSWRAPRDEMPELSEGGRRRGSRRAALAAVAGVALVGTIAGAAAAGVIGAPGPSRSAAGRSAVGRSAAGRSAAGRSAAGRSGYAPAGRQASSSNATSHDHASGHGHPTSDGRGTGQESATHHLGAAGRAGVAGGRTSCRSVAHIGDSISVDLISPDFLPNPVQRLPARYAAVGIKHLRIDASSGRSVIEALPGQVNGYNVARAWRDGGYRGCWVFALGTNDAADVANGSTVGYAARISEMMSLAHGEPVMWVNTVTTASTGFWASPNEQAWDRALIKAAAQYPNMRIFDWAAVAKPGWFLPDGIHYTSAGCAVRARAIADALARAFPLNGRSKGVVVK